MSEAEEAKTVEEVGQGDNSEDPGSEEPSSQGDNPSADIASQLMQNPQVLAALQSRLGDIVGTASGYIQSLPKPVKRRLKALKKLQFEATKIEAEFYREVHKLECKYAIKYAPLYEKRLSVVSGDYEPNDEEADWPSDDEKDEELSDKPNGDEEKSNSKEDVKNKASIEEKDEEKEKTDQEEKESDAKGVPGFWLTIFKNVDMLSEMIQPHDEPILNTLRDVKVEFVDINDTKDEKDPMGFKLQFHFDTNDYFENKVLTKEYVMRSVPDETDPFSFEGPEIVKCQGCTIDWKKGKNVTVKTVKKKQKHKASGTTRTISKTVQSDSFFNFFNPPTPPDDEEMDEDTESLLAADFEIGHFIRERIVPRAVLYFTGEALENDDEYDDEGEEEEGGDDYDEDADPDFDPQSGKFITPRFQAKCAKLALAQVTKPSSAPCDTRLLLRPGSASNPVPRPKSVSVTNQEQPSTSNTLSRPVTAPYSRPATQDKTVNELKPAVKTEAFTKLQTDVARPKSVSFKNTKVVGIEDQGELPKLEKERTKILSSVIEPKSSAQPLPEQIKLTREQTFFESSKTNEQIEVLETGAITAHMTLTCQKEIATKESKKDVQSKEARDDLRQKLKEKSQDSHDKHKVLQKTDVKRSNKGEEMNVDVCSREVEEKKDLRNVSAKTDTGLNRSRKPIKTDCVAKDKTVSVSGSVKKPETVKVTSQTDYKNQDGRHIEEASGNTKPLTAIGIGTRLSRHQAPDQAAPGEKRDEQKRSYSKPNKKPTTTKETAFTILKNLTGKRGTHKPGQVPSVQRPVRKYKFEKPAGPSSSQIIQSIIDDKKPREESENIKFDDGKGKSLYGIVKVPITEARSSKLRQLSTDNKQRPSSGTHPKQKSVPENTRSIKKPVSAPPQKAHKVDVERRSAKPILAKHSDKPPHSLHKDDKQSHLQGKLSEDSVKNSSQEAEEAGMSVSSSIKGVRLQNGMIATETEPSVESSNPEDKSDYSDIPNLHPKYKESPYLKDNPLLLSGKPRLRASASSLGRCKDVSL